ncbi:tetratricopeptide repeat protein [Acrocarpospora corrugata]|uniref:tetratricopeptide repeat protein n=1 Tax=Acrocarpospora corrugata TaxID=35763 RepID=UPI0030EEA8CF
MGPRPYSWADRTQFYGRKHENRRVRDLWEGSRFLVLHGPRGCGKSSLLAAGVMPALNDSNVVLPIGRISLGAGGVTPNHGIGNVHTFSLLSCWSPEQRPVEIQDMTLVDYFRNLPSSLDEYGESRTVLAAIDQFEDLFTAYPGRSADRVEFMDQLSTVMQEWPTLHVLVTLRDEFYADFLAYEDKLPRLELARERLLPLSAYGAVQAITGPLGGTERFLAPGLVESFVADLSSQRFSDGLGDSVTISTDRVDPIRLQTACSTYWTSLNSDLHQIEAGHLPALSEPREELLAWYRAAVARVAGRLDLSAHLLLAWVSATFLAHDGRARCALEGPAATRGMAHHVPAALERENVLVAHHRLGSRWYGLAHALLAEPVRVALPGGCGDHPQTWRHLAAAEDAWSQGAAAAARYQCTIGLKAATEPMAVIDLHALLGLMADVDSDLPTARSHYAEALNVAKSTQDTARTVNLALAMGRLERKAKQAASAIAWHQQAVDLGPSDPRAFRELGASCYEAGDRREALEAYNASLVLDARSFEALEATTGLLIDLGCDREAVEQAARALSVAPDPVAAARIKELRLVAQRRISQGN